MIGYAQSSGDNEGAFHILRLRICFLYHIAAGTMTEVRAGSIMLVTIKLSATMSYLCREDRLVRCFANRAARIFGTPILYTKLTLPPSQALRTHPTTVNGSDMFTNVLFL
jgi:hypothetical protein